MTVFKVTLAAKPFFFSAGCQCGLWGPSKQVSLLFFPTVLSLRLNILKIFNSFFCFFTQKPTLQSDFRIYQWSPTMFLADRCKNSISVPTTNQIWWDDQTSRCVCHEKQRNNSLRDKVLNGVLSFVIQQFVETSR